MTGFFRCEKCNAKIPNLMVSNGAWEAIERSLQNNSVALAIAELKHYANCDDKAARAFIDHVLNCAYAWPLAKEDEKILELIEKEFNGIDKPAHFTDYTHCDECYEHDQILINSSKNTATRKDFGNPGWDPITFSSAEGFMYYFPVLARFALLPDVWRDNDWYGYQMLSHLSYDGRKNKLFKICDDTQKKAVFSFLRHMKSTRERAITDYMADKELKKALEIWLIT